MRNKKNILRSLRYGVMGLPLAAIVGSSFLPLGRMGQQGLMLGALVWLQMVMLIEVYLSGS
jgi:hypothetical protein